MRNCIVAQSGGPTAVINASVMGVFDENLKTKYYKNVYCGLNGIEGILREDFINFSQMNYKEIENLKHTPSSALGSCRYKMDDFKDNEEDYNNLIKILNKLNIETFFYIGGNDSMDTVAKLSAYAKAKNIDIKFIGIPKTIDNDLFYTDHTPGFGSAAKFIATTTLETYLDSCVYTNNGIFILETMGRDAGWLAASSSLATLNNKPVADFIYLPEVAFDREKFLSDVKDKFKKQNQVYIVVSEGVRDKDGIFIAASSATSNDSFGHHQLGGAGETLKQMILDAKITTRVKSLELGVMQRCAMHCASQTDIDESHMVGARALNFSIEGATGMMVAIKRVSETPYVSDGILVDVSKVANKVKYFPKEWVNKKGNHISKKAINYLSPLVYGNPILHMEDGLPNFVKLRA